MYKSFLCFLVGCFATIYCLLWFFTFFISHFSYQISKDERLILSVEKQAGRILSEKYHMQSIGSGGGFEKNKVSLSSLSFIIKKPLSISEARLLIVGCIQDFLKIINENKELSPFLLNYPFTIENIEITVFINLPNGTSYYYPFIGVAAFHNGKIYYRSYDPNHKYKYKFEKEETFEEALKILALEKITLPNEPHNVK